MIFVKLFSSLFFVLTLNCYKTSFTRKSPFQYELLSSNDPDNDIATPKSFFLSKKTFADIGVSESIMGVISSLNLQRPSKIQVIAFENVYNGSSCIIADQTGSGKTLSYLLPLAQRLSELRSAKAINPVMSRQPFILVITPTSELASQVARVVRSIANVLKFRTACFTSDCDIDSEQKKLRLGVEILVATPGRLVTLLKKEDVNLDRCQTVVLDEADVLFSDLSFPLQAIGNACPTSTQFIFVTATLPDIITTQIRAEFPDIQYLTGPGLHRISPTVEEILIDCSGAYEQERSFETSFDNKRKALLKILDEESTTSSKRSNTNTNPISLSGINSNANAGSNSNDINNKVYSKAAAEEVSGGRTLIFCNTIAQCRNVENVLSRLDRNQRIREVYIYHSAIDNAQREESLLAFSKKKLDKLVIMVCTDRASRGLDFDSVPIDHVILFDFPSEPSEYVRRVGRTGRAGRFGKATIFVQGRQVQMARQIIAASIAGKRIEPIPELNCFESWSTTATPSGASDTSGGSEDNNNGRYENGNNDGEKRNKKERGRGNFLERSSLRKQQSSSSSTATTSSGGASRGNSNIANSGSKSSSDSSSNPRTNNNPATTDRSDSRSSSRDNNTRRK